MVYYDSAAIYVDAATTLQDKITRLSSIITALESAVLAAASNAHITEYSLDDGQTKIRTMYRSPTEVANSINAFEMIRQRYMNQLNGRVVRLVDSKNFTGGR